MAIFNLYIRDNNLANGISNTARLLLIISRKLHIVDCCGFIGYGHCCRSVFTSAVSYRLSCYYCRLQSPASSAFV